jgi:GntR family transcriptional repressor for pyruvate dehydrogenase complex
VTNEIHFQGQFHSESVPDRITARILRLIRDKQLNPGDQLPPERDLARIMQVSRASLRESIRSLAMLNVLEMRHGSGTYVSSLKPELLVEKLELVFSVNDSTFLDLIQARQVVEPGLAMLAALRVNPTYTQVLHDIMARSRDCMEKNPTDFPALDIEFHVYIAEMANNATLKRFLRSVTRLSIASSQRTATDVDSIRQAIEDHERITDAILSSDPSGASAAMLVHLRGVEDKIRKLVDSDPAS